MNWIRSHYELRDGLVQQSRGPADLMTGANMLTMAQIALAEARELSRNLVGKGEYLTFFKASIALQYHYATWIRSKLRALMLVKEATSLARAGRWEQANRVMNCAWTVFEEGSANLDQAYRIVKRHPRYFHVIEGVSHRGVECQLSDLSLRNMRGRYYKATIAAKPHVNNYGRDTYKELIKRIERMIRNRRVPNLEKIFRV